MIDSRISKTMNRIANNKHAEIINLLLSIFMFPVGLFVIKAPIAESILLSASFFLVTRIWIIHFKTSEINEDTSSDIGKLENVNKNVNAMNTTVNTINTNTNTANDTVNTISDNVNMLAVSIGELSAITNYRKIVLENLADTAQNLSKLSDTEEQTFFYQWYRKELTKLTKNLRNTNDSKYVRFMVYRLHDEEHQIYKVFESKRNRFFYAPCTCKSIKWWLNPYGECFTKFIHKNVQSGNIEQVRRIFIYENEKEFRSALVKFAFVLHNNGVYKFKIISKTRFDARFNTRNGTGNHKADFGIFGEEYVWEVTNGTDEGGPISGDFSMDENKVNWYKQFFNEMWDELDDYKFNDNKIGNEIVLACAKYAEQGITKLPKLYEDYEKEKARKTA
ncbi:MAG: hypothetical protein FWE73_01160 [Candidatus Bathyarchaeota archaeon]|nr:hypothetical protein [Candidatus Termitimicrobium sp.]